MDNENLKNIVNVEENENEDLDFSFVENDKNEDLKEEKINDIKDDIKDDIKTKNEKQEIIKDNDGENCAVIETQDENEVDENDNEIKSDAKKINFNKDKKHTKKSRTETPEWSTKEPWSNTPLVEGDIIFVKDRHSFASFLKYGSNKEGSFHMKMFKKHSTGFMKRPWILNIKYIEIVTSNGKLINDKFEIYENSQSGYKLKDEFKDTFELIANKKKKNKDNNKDIVEDIDNSITNKNVVEINNETKQEANV